MQVSSFILSFEKPMELLSPSVFNLCVQEALSCKGWARL